MRARLVTAIAATVVALIPAGLVLGAQPAVAGGDPGGNNGTLKVAEVGAPDGNANDPHVGCTFELRWFGFDLGRSVVSAVSFTAQSPYQGGIEVTRGDTFVHVGGDHARGGDLDGTMVYTLAFDGPANHKDGYKVKVTAQTPGSKGNDTKSKVFWVQPCADEDGDEPDTPETPEPPGTPETPFSWDWEYAAPSCTAVTIAYPSNIPDGQANDVNVRIETGHGQRTLNFHNNEGSWSGTTPFVFAGHPQWPADAAEYHVTWVQVGGTNYHWQGDVGCLTDGDAGTVDSPVAITEVSGFRTGSLTVARGRAVAAAVVSVAQSGGAGLDLQQLRSGSWTTLKTVAATDGTARVTFPKLTKRGTYSFRLAVAGSAVTTGDTTGVLTVRVR